MEISNGKKSYEKCNTTMLFFKVHITINFSELEEFTFKLLFTSPPTGWANQNNAKFGIIKIRKKFAKMR